MEDLREPFFSEGILAWGLAGCMLTSPFAVHAQTSCQTHPLMFPAKGEALTHSQPVLRWQGDAQASYRVQMVMQQPEGRQLSIVDTTVAGPQWAVPTVINLPQVAVKVLISSHCPLLNTQHLLAQPPSFFIQTQAPCGIEAGSLSRQGAEVNWRSSGHADSYRVELHGIRQESMGSLGSQLPVARVLAHADTQQPRWTVPFAALAPIAPDEMRVASVQAQCDGRLSPARTLELKLVP